jgi:hypothetical protein
MPEEALLRHFLLATFPAGGVILGDLMGAFGCVRLQSDYSVRRQYWNIWPMPGSNRAQTIELVCK